jgi:hypothetical protein
VYDRHVTYRFTVGGARAGSAPPSTCARRFTDFAALHRALIAKLGVMLQGMRAGGGGMGGGAGALSASGLDALASAPGEEMYGEGLHLPRALAALRAFPFPGKAPLLSAVFLRPLAPSLLQAPEVARRARAFAAYLKLLEGTGLAALREVRAFVGVE